MTWPPAWEGPNFKPARGTKTKDRKRRARRAQTGERKAKQEVRDRDVACRFPKCLCRFRRLRLDVSHLRHKGMGGNPRGDRSKPELMVFLCVQRHIDGKVSVDKETLRWIPLTENGANGAIAWEVDRDALYPGTCYHLPKAERWVTIATETEPGKFLPFTDYQLAMLTKLQETMV